MNMSQKIPASKLHSLYSKDVENCRKEEKNGFFKNTADRI